MKIRLELVLVVAAAVIVGVLAYATGSVKAKPVSVASTYDSGPNGYRALYEVLLRAGVRVTRFERVLGVLDPSVKTLVITGYENDPAAKPLDEHDGKTLERFVRNGGRFIAVDTIFAGKNDLTPGVGTSEQISPKIFNPSYAIALARVPLTAGVKTVRGPIRFAFPLSERGVPLLANESGIVALYYRYGRGEVIAITAPALFSNAHLRDADNMRFFFNSVAGRGPIVFEEYAHGYDDGISLWAALPLPVRAAVFVLGGLTLLALVGANVPFAPPYLPNAPDERDSSDYISSIAELMRRSRRRPADADVIYYAQVAFRDRKEPV